MTSPLSTFAHGVSPEWFKYSKVETTKRTPQIIFSNRPYCALAVTLKPAARGEDPFAERRRPRLPPKQSQSPSRSSRRHSFELNALAIHFAARSLFFVISFCPLYVQVGQNQFPVRKYRNGRPLLPSPTRLSDPSSTSSSIALCAVLRDTRTRFLSSVIFNASPSEVGRATKIEALAVSRPVSLGSPRET